MREPGDRDVMQMRNTPGPLFHFLIASGLLLASFAMCEFFHLFDPTHRHPHPRPEVHLLFVPHGMIVLLAWIYGWIMVPLLLPAMLLSSAYIVGPEHMTPTVALLTLSRLVLVMIAMEAMKLVCCDARRDGGRAGVMALFAAGTLATLTFNVLRMAYSPCCEAMTLAERVMTYAMAVAADLAGLLVVMLGAMFLFRALRHG